MASDVTEKIALITSVSQAYVDVVRDFLILAKAVGRTIISETFLSIPLKTIKPGLLLIPCHSHHSRPRGNYWRRKVHW